MLFAPLIVAASAAEPVIDAHATGAVVDRVAGGVGGGIGAGWSQVEVMLELDAVLTDGPQGVISQGMVHPRLSLFPSAEEGPRGHLIVGGGAWSRPDLVGVVEAGAGLDLSAGPLRPRITATYVAGADGSGRAMVTLGVVRHPTPEPEPEPVAMVPRFDAAMVWVPDPVCEWLPPDDAGSSWGATEAEVDGATVVPQPATVAAEGSQNAALGDLVVAAFPDDQVTIDGEPLAVDRDGIAWTQAPAGRVEVAVLGGGRQVEATVAVAPQGTLWYSAPAPDTTVRVTFDAGSAQLSDGALAQLAQFRDQLASWPVQVWGSFSPEGIDTDNEALARARAEAVAAALEEAGVPPGRVTVLPPRPPEEGLPASQQRAAVLSPVYQDQEETP